MENILVSVCVLMHNSSKFILETLESVKNQSYLNLELIICDDASTDTSVEICESWLNSNKTRFVRTAIFVNEKNKGIAPTRNYIVQQSNGEWIKFLDSDDILSPNSIQSYVNTITEETHFIVGNYCSFNEKGETQMMLVDLDFFNSSVEIQEKLQATKCRITLPALLLKKKTFLALNGFDERFPMLEDFPFFKKALENSYRFDCVNELVINYRVHTGSIQRSKAFHKSHVMYVNQVVVPEHKKSGKYILYWHDKLWSNRELAKLNGESLKASLIYCLMLITDPKEWYYIIRDKIYRPLIFKYRAIKNKA